MSVNTIETYLMSTDRKRLRRFGATITPTMLTASQRVLSKRLDKGTCRRLQRRGWLTVTAAGTLMEGMEGGGEELRASEPDEQPSAEPISFAKW